MAYGGSDAALNELISGDLLLFECFLGFLPCVILLILTQVFGYVYMYFLPDIWSIGTCFKTTDTVDWLGEKNVKTGSGRMESTVK